MSNQHLVQDFGVLNHLEANLPVELVQHIATFLPLRNFLALRATSRGLRTCLERQFLQFFETRNVELSLESFLKLEEISKQTHLSEKVSTIRFGVDLINTEVLTCDALARLVPSFREQISGLGAWQLGWLVSRRLMPMLTDIFYRFTNLSEVVILDEQGVAEALLRATCFRGANLSDRVEDGIDILRRVLIDINTELHFSELLAWTFTTIVRALVSSGTTSVRTLRTEFRRGYVEDARINELVNRPDGTEGEISPFFSQLKTFHLCVGTLLETTRHLGNTKSVMAKASELEELRISSYSPYHRLTSDTRNLLEWLGSSSEDNNPARARSPRLRKLKILRLDTMRTSDDALYRVLDKFIPQLEVLHLEDLVICCDLEDTYPDIATRFDDKVDQARTLIRHLRSASDSLRELVIGFSIYNIWEWEMNYKRIAFQASGLGEQSKPTSTGSYEVWRWTKETEGASIEAFLNEVESKVICKDDSRYHV